MFGQVKRPRARKQRQTTTKGWGGAAPKLRSERRAVFARCGPSAFLMPNKADPGLSKFPVVSKRGPCVPDCRGVRTALSRATRFGYQEVARRARALGKRAACRWAE